MQTSDYDGEIIGSGRNGPVKRIWHNNKYVAKKIVMLEDFEGRSESLRSLNHERIVQYIEFIEGERSITILMELMPGFSLKFALWTTGSFSEQVTRRYTTQILEGLNYLHSKKILHRDIKCANVLRDRKPDSDVPNQVEECHMQTNIKLCDFGVSRELHTLSHYEAKTYCGTHYWIAPELKLNQRYSYPADIWSLGCTVYEMLATHPPKFEWPLETPIEIPPIPTKELTDSTWAFLKATLSADASERPLCQDLLGHPFLDDTVPTNTEKAHVPQVRLTKGEMASTTCFLIVFKAAETQISSSWKTPKTQTDDECKMTGTSDRAFELPTIWKQMDEEVNPEVIYIQLTNQEFKPYL